MSTPRDRSAEDTPRFDGGPATQNDTAGAAKDRFREALERKRGKQHPHEAASQHDSKVHDAQGAATKRMFRRKSG
jgi:hypothetical protein